MLDINNYEELTKIVQRANDFLDGHDASGFSLIGINWDGEDSQWIVTYQSNFANSDFMSVWVSKVDNRYELVGHSSFEL